MGHRRVHSVTLTSECSSMAENDGDSNKPPGWLDKVNYVIDSFVDPCQAPFLLKVRLALPAAGEMIMQLVEFDQLDVVRAMFRPKPVPGGRTYRHSRRGRKGGPSGPGLLSPGENIGHRLRGATHLPTASDSRKLDFLWQIDNIGQRAFFWWMVADVGVDGFYRWATLIEQSPVCADLPGGTQRYRIQEQGLLGLLDWHTPLMGQATPGGTGFPWFTAPGGFRCDAGPYKAIWWCNLYNPLQMPVGAQLGFWVDNSTAPEPEISGDVVMIPPLSFQTYFIEAQFHQGQAGTFAGRAVGGRLTGFNWNCVLFQS